MRGFILGQVIFTDFLHIHLGLKKSAPKIFSDFAFYSDYKIYIMSSVLGIILIISTRTYTLDIFS